MAWVDLEYYKNKYGGVIIPDNNFSICRKNVERRFVFIKKNMNDVQKEVLKKCICKISEIMYIHDSFTGSGENFEEKVKDVVKENLTGKIEYTESPIFIIQPTGRKLSSYSFIIH